MAKKELSWILKAKDSVTTVLNRVGKSIKSFASGGIGLVKNLAAGFALVGGAAFALGARFVSSYQKASQSSAKLTSVLKATGYAAGYTTSQLQDQAAELQKQTGIDGDLILSMQGVLASFRNISGENFQEATKAILDMSTVMQKAGQDEANIEQASIQVGKALNDPIKGLTALSKVGVTFTEVQKQQIEAMQKAGDIAGAQKIILTELKNEFGGAAEGIDSNVKAYRVFMAALGDTEEEIGRAITENMALGSVFEKLTKILNDLSESGAIDAWAEDLASAIESMMPLINKLGEALGNTFSYIQYAARRTGGFIGAMMEGSSINDALKISAEVENEMQKESTFRLERIKRERAEKKKAQAEQEQADMKEGQARFAAINAENDRVGKEAEISKITEDLEYRIRLQELLNKGKETEAELMKIQKDLGRELTDQEKARVSEKIDALRAAEEEGAIREDKPRAPEIALEKIGAIFSKPPELKDNQEEIKKLAGITKKTNEILWKIYEKNTDSSLGVV